MAFGYPYSPAGFGAPYAAYSAPCARRGWIWFAVVIILFILLLIFFAWWWFSCFYY
ncbi:hypothetical protein [Neobacillus sp. SAB-20_R2A]|uniref:hypothetical protein n=1 Tax=Neobacillus sp. SAB-20_R2A TaxID=3120519 RepID=UPI003C6E1EF5